MNNRKIYITEVAATIVNSDNRKSQSVLTLIKTLDGYIKSNELSLVIENTLKQFEEYALGNFNKDMSIVKINDNLSVYTLMDYSNSPITFTVELLEFKEYNTLEELQKDYNTFTSKEAYREDYI